MDIHDKSARAFLYTIGHSTRPIEDLVGILQNYVVLSLIDVRRVPRSTRNPQYRSEALSESLRGAGIEYSHWPELGGLRDPLPDSINTGWKQEGFRGFADYMQTPEFEAAVSRLVLETTRRSTAILCAEASYKKCHRMLISDAMTARGVDVIHLVAMDQMELHRLTPFARVRGTRITYGAPIQQSLFD